MTYSEKLNARIAETGSRLCVGLDPRPEQIEGDVGEFLRQVVAETAPFAAAFKPNMGYFEAMGVGGVQLLEGLLQDMPKEVPVILDCKRSDIGETQKYYARAYFEEWDVDAVTLNPFLGFDTIEPFLGYEGRGVYLLAVTSNAGSAEFQMQKSAADGRFIFEHVQDMAEKAADFPGDVGLVVGLTNASEEVRSKIADVPLLVPGLGAQGGELDVFTKEARHAPIVINVSRGITFAEPDLSFADKAKRYADQIADVFRGSD